MAGFSLYLYMQDEKLLFIVHVDIYVLLTMVYIAGCEDGEVAKLEALRHVLLFATARKLSNVLFVSDCINVVKFIEGNNECILWTNFLLVLKCRILFNQLLNYSADIMWVFMKCNVVAHTLACNGRKIMCTSSVI